ncbi:unnamed protein product [Cuscuta epithymum]|uniref:Uncharacterized protein n=1 Tax=Cuscuta epithymum TaxID=186058 RepID=A0AAV0CKV6_9ASTE|nr:unnamed protein product [Cuscuta epithymum]CAH9132869.1 unnamed protein product [Cuscuta epithymum]
MVLVQGKGEQVGTSVFIVENKVIGPSHAPINTFLVQRPAPMSSDIHIRFILSSNRFKITLGTIGEHHKWKEGAKVPRQNEDSDFWCCTRSGMPYTRSGKSLKN